MKTTRYKLTIEYDGTDYCGWQRQPVVPSVQQAIEEALSSLKKQDITIVAAGRTDAGVHGRGQVAHVDMPPFSRKMSELEILKAINAYLRPQLVSIIKVEKVADDFHARFDAVNKLYKYRIINRSGFLTVDKGLAWHIKQPICADAMREGAKYLLGEHDFTTFRDSECQAKSPIKVLDRLDITSRPYGGCGGSEIIIETEGQSFLHHQVRNFVGTLSLVGLGKWKPQDIKSALEACDRTKGGPTSPPQGLYLMRIDY